jgi:hypothetical protein
MRVEKDVFMIALLVWGIPISIHFPSVYFPHTSLAIFDILPYTWLAPAVVPESACAGA